MALSSTDAFMASLESDEEELLLISNLSPLLLDCSLYPQKSAAPSPSSTEFLNLRSGSLQEIGGDDGEDIDGCSFPIGGPSPAAAFSEQLQLPQQERTGNMDRQLGYGGREEEELTRSKLAAGADPRPGTKGSGCGGDLYRQTGAAQAEQGKKKAQESSPSSERHSRGCGKSTKNVDCERRRRERLKESLYALRASVPSITKMDKASIISDAIDHVQCLQKQVMDTEVEIFALKSWGLALKRNNINGHSCPISSIQQNNKERKILELDVTKLEKSTYELKVLCLKGSGVLLNLCKAIDSLQLDIINANLMAFDDLIVSTLFVEATYGAELKPSELKGMISKVLSIFGLEIVKD